MKYFRLVNGQKIEASRNFCVETIRSFRGGNAEEVLNNMSYGTQHHVGDEIIIKEIE